jgi:RHS repeat-associated protein
MKTRLRIVTAIAALLTCTLVNAAPDWSAQDYDLYSGDFNGDGPADVLYIARDPAKVSGIATSAGGTPSIAWQSWPSNYLGIPWSGGTYNVIVADFNGDGKSDVFLQRKTPGDSYVLLSDANGKISSIWQSVSYSALGLTWSADQHHIVAGDFSGDGRADLFLQAAGTSGTNAIVAASANGQFTSGPLQSWGNSYLGFKWSVANAKVSAGDFNGDGYWDLLVQAKPNIVLIDYDVPIPVPTYAPNSFGVAKSQGGASPFQLAGIQQWSRNSFGVDWSASFANTVVADFNGDGRADVLLQAKTSGRTSWLLNGNSSGSILSSAAAISANVAISADSARLIAGRFSGSGGAALYIQSTSGTNYLASSVTSTISASAHTPSLSGPQPSTATGNTPGTFSVSNTGAARYDIPVVVPPGVQGLQPSVALSYSSSSRNGWVGMGWGLTGMSRITRCGWTVDQDGENKGVALTTDDRFCLNGNRLRLTGGTYGLPNSTYQTELEEFARITASPTSAGNGPSYFVVEGKNGRKYWYGATEDSRIQAVNSPTAPTTPHTWMLSQVQDRAGNTMTYSYLEDGAPEGSFRPSEIIYGAGTAQTYKVKYVWDPRTNVADYVSDYTLGAAMRETFRLNKIETWYKPPGGSFQLVRKYQLGYQTGGTLRSQLTTVQECDGNSRCLTPTSVGWQQATSGWSSSEIPSSTAPSNSYAVDFDADGRTDFVYLQLYNGFLTWHYIKANAAGGFDAPERTAYGVNDINNSYAVPIKLAGSARTGLLVNNGNFRYILAWSGAAMAPLYPPGTGGLTATPKGLWAGDFNGDGYSDILFAVRTGPSSTQFHLQAGSATVFGSPQLFATTSFFGAANPVDPYNLARKIDFNGDGKDDLIVQTSSVGYGLNCSPELPECVQYEYDIHHWRAFVSTGSSLTELAVSETGGCECQTFPVLPGDFNGDGLTDLVAGSWSESNPGNEDWSFHWNIRQGASTGLTGPTAVTLPLSEYMIAGEFTGDGRSDVIYTTGYPSDPSQTWMLTRWTGASFDTAVSTGIVSSTPESVRTLDVNGDSLTDIGYYSGGSYRVRPHNGPIPDLVQSIDDGFGNAFTVTYATLTDSTVYTKGSDAIFPLVDVQPAIPVVKQYIATDGSGGTYTISEKYSALRENQWGRGSVGFAHREETDHRTNAQRVRQWDFRQDFPYIGMASREWVTQGLSAAGSAITDISYEPENVRYGTSFRYHVYVKKSTQTSYEVGGALNGQPVAEVVTTIDSVGTFGVPLSTTTKTKDLQSGSPWQNQVFTRVTVNSDILDDQNNWCVGQPRQTTTTETLPDSTSRARTVTRAIDAAMCRTTDDYNEPSNAALRVDTHYEFDSCGNVRQIDVTGRNPNGTPMALRRTELNYSYYTDRCVSPEKITNALSQVGYRSYRYDLGVQSGETDANGLALSWQYDGFGRKTREQRPDGTATDWYISGCTQANSYCGTGDASIRSQVQEVDRNVLGSDIGTTTVLVDGRGRARLTGTQLSGGVWSYTAQSYDALGRLSTQSLPYSQVSNGRHRYSYDLRNRPTRDELLNASNGVDRFTSWSYAGGTVVVTDPKTNASLHSGAATKRYDVMGQLRRVVDPAPGGTTGYDYTYDANGNQIVTVTDAANNVSTVKLDLLGRKTSSDDADMGHWIFGYDSLGEQVSQTDARGQSMSYTYDPLGRMATRNEPEGETVWTWGTSSAARNIGRLEKVTSPGDPGVSGDQYKEEYTYDNLGRVQTVKYTQDGAYYVDYSYSDQGRLDTLTYPTSTSGYRLKVKYLYSNGQLMQVKDANDGTVFWTLNAVDDAGRAIDENFGNGLHQITGYDSLTGTMVYRQSGSAGSATNLQNLSYQWDVNGNLKQRRSHIQNPILTEDFYYDTLNRLDYSQLNNTTNLDVTVDAIGNLTYKSDVGTFNYTTAQGVCSYSGLTSQPHAVRNAGGVSYCYDANGNMTARGTGMSVQWTSFNLPRQIAQGSNSSQFLYGAGRNRWKQVASYGGQPETTLYVGGLMEKVTVTSGTAYRHYIGLGDQAAIYTRWSTGTNQIAYITTDHLGSSSAITNATGAIIANESFDAFGQRRGSNWSGVPTPTELANISNTTRHGFTGHEHLDNLNLIHMNGRVFSPGLGRFMSADPFVQNAADSQTLNRYSYVSNNPLTFTDPSGFATVRETCTQLAGNDAMHGPADDMESVTVRSTFVPTCTYEFEPDLVSAADMMPPSAFVSVPQFEMPSISLEQVGSFIDDALFELLVKPVFGWADCGRGRCTATETVLKLGGAPLNAAGGIVGTGAVKLVGRAVVTRLAAREVAAAANSGVTVLGSFPAYVQLGERLGANYFSIPAEKWAQMTAAEQWAANRAFLDAAIARGDRFIFSNDFAPAGSFFQRELQYLEQQGVFAGVPPAF